MTSFRITDNKGFHITFPNGITLSTQFGAGNYGDNYDNPIYMSKEDREKCRGFESWQVEVAAWDKSNKWITDEYKKDYGGVIGYLDVEEWLKFFDWCRNYKPILVAKEG